MTLFFIVVMLGAAYYVFTQAVEGGQPVPVPDVTGLSITEASNILTQAGFEIGTQRQVMNEQVPEYHVIVQRPTANTVLRQGRKINITISQGRAMIKAPNFLGQRLEEAFKAIEEARFTNGSVARIADSSPRDTVLAQDPAPSQGISVGTEVHLLVSAGPRQEVMLMPDIVGMSLAEVKMRLASMNVQAVPYVLDRAGDSYEIVLGQYPAPGATLIPNQEVNFDVRLRPTSDLPNARRKATIQYKVPLTNEYSVEIRIETIDEAGRRTVIYPRISDYIDNRPPRFQAGQLFTGLEIPYTNQLTVEFYANRWLHQSYHFSGASEPVITTVQDLSPEETTVESSDLPN